MAYNGTSGIPVSGSFRLRVSEPVDSRYVINNELELEFLIADNAFYPGLEFTLLQNAGSYDAGKYFVTADGTFKKIYNLDGTSPDYLVSSDLSGYASEEYVREQINNAQLEIPEKLSDLTNDTGYISSSVADSTYVKKDELVWHEF